MMKGLVLIGLVVGIGFLSGLAHGQEAAIGDSIAQGTGAALGVQNYGRVGASSCSILSRLPTAHFHNVVISAGINDPPGRCVAAIRNAIHADQVVWILPAAINSARLTVAAVAARHGDVALAYGCRGGCSKTRFHPESYALLARWVRQAWTLGEMK